MEFEGGFVGGGFALGWGVRFQGHRGLSGSLLFFLDDREGAEGVLCSGSCCVGDIAVVVFYFAVALREVDDLYLLVPFRRAREVLVFAALDGLVDVLALGVCHDGCVVDECFGEGGCCLKREVE